MKQIITKVTVMTREGEILELDNETMELLRNIRSRCISHINNKSAMLLGNLRASDAISPKSCIHDQ